jgi:rhamnosyltransferase
MKNSPPCRAIIFVHYDKNNIVDDYIYFYLKELQKNTSHLVFVSTAKLSEETIDKVSNYCSKVIVRENIGYDFMSYKVGLESFDYTQYNEVVICNDSVYGPLYPLKNVFEEIQKNACDFWGITDNTDMSYHLQSYFLVFRKNIVQSDAFKSFWEDVKVLNDKYKIIKQYEVGLTQYLHTSGFKSETYTTFKPTYTQIVVTLMKKLTLNKIVKKAQSFLNGNQDIKRIGRLNTTHHFWKELLLSERMPFIKIELLRENPMHMNIVDIEEVITKISKYDTKLITKHLIRMKENKCTK